MGVKVMVNDEELEVDEDTTVSALLETLGFPNRGVAVALNWAVLPRSQWNSVVPDGARVEVVTAVQGG
jgi:sulfur carrier protein